MNTTSNNLIAAAQTVSIRKSNGAVQQIIRAKADEYVARGWSVDTVATIGNGAYNVVLSREAN